MDSRADHVRLFRNAGDQPETDDFATTPLRPGYEVEFEDRVIRRQGGDYEENIPDLDTLKILLHYEEARISR